MEAHLQKAHKDAAEFQKKHEHTDARVTEWKEKTDLEAQEAESWKEKYHTLMKNANAEAAQWEENRKSLTEMMGKIQRVVWNE